MKIVRPGTDQYEDVRSFYHSMCEGIKDSDYDFGWKKDIYPSPEFISESIRKGEMYIGLEEDRIAAAMVLNHEYNESYKKFEWQTKAEDSEILLIHALGVHQDLARRGYAKQMVEKAVDLAKETGMKAIRLDVLKGNLPAEKLYLGFGFRRMATLRMYYEDTGWTDFDLYEYLL